MNINIAIIGKTGVGKSSFCNYIFGDTFSETGSGKPVTGWDKNFSMATTQYKNFTLNIFDSVGLEADNLPRWSREFNQFIEQRKISMKVNLDQWLHGVFYLLNAASARVETVELDIINEIKASGTPLLVIFTNVDNATNEQIEELQRTVKEKTACTNIAKVCSVTKKLRVGSVEKKGKKEALDLFFENLYEKIEGSIFKCMVQECGDFFDVLFIELTSKINDMDLGLISIIKSIKYDTNPFDDKYFDSLDKIGNKYISEIEAVISFIESLGGKSRGEFLTKYENFKEKIETQLKESEAEFWEEFKIIERGLDSYQKWENIKAFGKAIYTVATLKSKITNKLFETRAVISVIVHIELQDTNI